jgi:hypothetical protein
VFDQARRLYTKRIIGDNTFQIRNQNQNDRCHLIQLKKGRLSKHKIIYHFDVIFNSQQRYS